MTTKRARPRRLRAAAPSEKFPSLAPHASETDGGELTLQSKQLLRAQSELAEARNRYAALYDLAPIGYLTLDHQGVIIEANLAAGVLCDQPRGYLIGLALMNVVSADDRDQLRLFTDQARIAAGGLVAKDLTLNTRSRRTVRLLGRSVRTPEGLAQLLTAMIDVTAEKQLAEDKAHAYEAAQRKSDALANEVEQRIATEERVKALLERLVTVQEEERRRLALNLHDHLGQQLTALRLTLSTLRDAGSDAERTRQFDLVEQIVSQLDRDVDFLAWELRPPALDDVGLEAALAEFVRQWSSANGVVAEFHKSAKGGARLSPDIESHLYRIVQEALNNVSKHAQASHVSVILERRVDEMRVIVEDDGSGFELADELMRIKRGSMGLTGIRERVALIGGDFELESAPGKGTTLFVRIPLHAAIASETEPKDVDLGRR
jgi:PAS domain S-box-containing protein